MRSDVRSATGEEPEGVVPPLALTDFHVHLRGGMTVEKAVARQATSGIRIGVLRNMGTGWPIETDDQLEEHIDSTIAYPLLVGVQVNDRDWHTRHSEDLLDRLDFVLADTMIMPMPDQDGSPVKLWMDDSYRIGDPQSWMALYMRHNLQVLSEPITILANPTYLPPALADMYDELWTESRMRQVIAAAVANGVALEIQAGSRFPSDDFVRAAKDMGARFTIGSNNFDDSPTDMARCFRAIRACGLTQADMLNAGG